MGTPQGPPAAGPTGRTLPAAVEGARPCDTETLDSGLQTVRRQMSVVPTHLACRTLLRWPQDLRTGEKPEEAGLGGGLEGGADALRGSEESWKGVWGPGTARGLSPHLPIRGGLTEEHWATSGPARSPSGPTPSRPPWTTSLRAAAALSPPVQAWLDLCSTGSAGVVLSPSVPLWAPLLSDTPPPGPVVGLVEVLAAHWSPHEDGHRLVPAMALRLAASAPRLDPKENSRSLRQWQGATRGGCVAGECLEAGVKLEGVLLCLWQVVTILSP